jgi:tetratricopeptide (TPR) repeat protein
MAIGSLSATLLAALLLSILAALGLPNCLGRTPWTRLDAAAQSAIQAKEPPFDKLELFAFFAAGPTNSYTRHVIQERGTDFTPDASFVSSFPFPDKQTILRAVKPRAPHAPSPNRGQAYELLRKAYDAQRNRQLASAGESYQQALQLAPNSATLHSAYAADLLLSHNYASSDEQSRLCLKLWPQDAEAHAMLALSMTLQKRFPEAELESREALRIFPQHISATFTLAHSLTNQRKYKEALPVVRQAMAAWPTMTALTKFLGIALVETGDTTSGIEKLSSYVKVAPDDAEGHYYLGVALRVKGSSAEAHLEFLEALRLQPTNVQYEVAAHPELAPPATDSGLGPKPEDGSISGNIYTNKFFGFTYEFPKGWGVLSSDAARSTVEIGGLLVSTGDPTEEDIKKAAGIQAHPLLYVMEGRVENQPLPMKTVMVIALDIQSGPGTTAESYIKAMAQRAKQTGAAIAMETSGSPEERLIGGRSFWKGNFIVRTATGTGYGSQCVRAEKGYLLVFFLAGPDLASLGEVEKSLDSMHFLNRSN